ncbi:hypothetical protein GA0004736_0912 [Curtobacterium sp. 9128]|uniref:hypothetical protein n=1 Tax=Curtobacterium sp. 9128 TaxID=1793722 RepID=UPI0007D727A8|nr:hypothetical protein [Curtobacterium sp. 9128]SBN62014.1 hypothetical protein GA0004736_0912 [Curtobacterium sp. 9128]
MNTNRSEDDLGTPIHDRTAAAEGHEVHPGVTVPSWSNATPVPPAATPTPVPAPAGAASGGAASGGGTSGGGASGAGDAAKDVAGDAKEKAGDVAGTAKEQASKVASEAADHAKELYGQASENLKEQASQQQQRAAGGLRSLGEQLGHMAEKDDEQGIAAKVVRDLAGRATSVAGYLDDRDPGSLLGEVKSFAAKRPATFIAIAAGAGILAGRLTKALTADAKHTHEAEAARHDPTTGPTA